MKAEQLQTLHEAGLHVLHRTGIVFQEDETVRLLTSRGYRVDGSRVFIPPEAVEDALSTAPGSFTLKAREPRRDLVVGNGDLVSSNAAGALRIATEGTTRPLTGQDLRKWVRLCHMAPNLDMLGGILAPSGGSSRQDLLRSVYDSVTLTDKVYEFPLSEPEHLRVSLKILEILFGADWHSHQRLPVILNCVSPLLFPKHVCATVRLMADLGQPLGITPAALGGMTGPVTVAGLLVQQHAEVMAGLVLVQLLRPGCPYLYGGFSSSTSMSTGDFALGSPEFWGVAAATVELATHLGLPVRAGAGGTDSHMVDVQAGIETALGLSLVIERGVDLILHGSGAISSLNAVSLEKLLIDDALLGLLRRRPWDVAIDDDRMAVSVIDRVGPGGSFLTQRHTRTHYRETEQSPLFNRRGFDAWRARGGVSPVEAAALRVDAMLEAYRAPEIDAVVERQLRRTCLDPATGM
jgi:trimethylamine--corrinoid protein Co-methyltransferase